MLAERQAARPFQRRRCRAASPEAQPAAAQESQPLVGEHRVTGSGRGARRRVLADSGTARPTWAVLSESSVPRRNNETPLMAGTARAHMGGVLGTRKRPRTNVTPTHRTRVFGGTGASRQTVSFLRDCHGGFQCVLRCSVSSVSSGSLPLSSCGPPAPRPPPAHGLDQHFPSSVHRVSCDWSCV